ncbi:universal stress protein [Olleya aquimaris]|uniref:Universal stress protein n=1 Tax=Olleya sediminilitoris TaxID=2795739 RepID=A0ABS1WPY4_9FLAO|nr:universal stress protein [Olleya sediminilitoris]AXO78922.1 universal stress protein [Olleya aquimaris]MBL7561143.1 universal stress protein [Olleya sediminilitoris]
MKTILLPTDFSDNSWNAIQYALNFYKHINCTFYLLHVNRLSDTITNDNVYLSTIDVIDEMYIKPSKKQLNKLLKKIATSFPENTKHTFYTISDHNFFIDSVRKHVEEKKIDLIVMGTKGASGLQKYILGTNTGDIITKVHCNTLVIPEQAKYTTVNEVAFPTDFLQFYGSHTLQPISDILEQQKATVRVLHITKKQKDLNEDQKQNKDFLEDYFSQFISSFHFLTNTKVEAAVQCFVESRNIDMIAMVAKNLNYFQQILFHNKVEDISYQTTVPFLVLHE